MKIFVIPDCQIRPGDDTKFLRNIGRYIAEKEPDVIVNIGDFADMPSLSSYDIGKKAYEGRRYRDDVHAVQSAMFELCDPIRDKRHRQFLNKKKLYTPRMIMTLGNHENRINRAINNDPKLEGTISIDDLNYEHFGWDVYKFLDVVVVEGVAFSHYFSTGVAGRPASTAAAQLNKKHQSCISGHQQGLMIAHANRADGKRITSVIAGSCYEHNEEYLGPQGNKHWRGCLMLHNVNEGEFDLATLPLSYFEDRYK